MIRTVLGKRYHYVQHTPKHRLEGIMDLETAVWASNSCFGTKLLHGVGRTGFPFWISVSSNGK